MPTRSVPRGRTEREVLMSDHLHNKFVELRVCLDTFLSRLDQRFDETPPTKSANRF